MAPTKQDLHDQAVAGEEITQQVVDELRQEETPQGAQQPPRGSTAAMAQSLHDKQQNLEQVVEEVTSKPESELTQEDASKVMSAESRAMGGIRPPKGSTSAHVQSVATHNAQAQQQQQHDDKAPSA